MQADSERVAYILGLNKVERYAVMTQKRDDGRYILQVADLVRFCKVDEFEKWCNDDNLWFEYAWHMTPQYSPIPKSIQITRSNARTLLFAWIMVQQMFDKQFDTDATIVRLENSNDGTFIEIKTPPDTSNDDNSIVVMVQNNVPTRILKSIEASVMHPVPMSLGVHLRKTNDNTYTLIDPDAYDAFNLFQQQKTGLLLGENSGQIEAIAVAVASCVSNALSNHNYTIPLKYFVSEFDGLEDMDLSFSESKLCAYCIGKEAKVECVCCGTRFCSKECQVADWKENKHAF